jgi:hypothetical protein
MIQKYDLKKVINRRGVIALLLLREIKESDGDSFLLGMDLLMNNAHKFTFNEIKQYVMLAGLRDYNEYKRTGILSLDMDMCPVSQEILSQNRLLYTLNNNLFFRYEEEAICV